MARELFVIEDTEGVHSVRDDVYLTREEVDGAVGSEERIVRYVPEGNAEACLATIHARLTRFAEKASIHRMPAELCAELVAIVKAAEGGAKVG